MLTELTAERANAANHGGCTRMTKAGPSPDLAAKRDGPAHMRRRAILACPIGNFLEFYDFTRYGFFAIFVGQTFFPSTNPVVSLLSSLATFGVGFVMRPVGGLVMGAYADRFGRKGALIVTMAMMAVATGIPGLMPCYATIGTWVPIVLVLCRLAQGFSTGGDWDASVIFMVEYAPPGHRGFYASWMQVGVATPETRPGPSASSQNDIWDRETT